MRRFALLFACGFLAIAPLGAEPAQSSACRPPAAEGLEAVPEEATSLYPDQQLSPLESLRRFDIVFQGDVVVPSRPCSLGYCAGLRLVRRIKGNPGKTVLLQVSSAKTLPCGPSRFLKKGERWVVFANQGTSRTGYKYFSAGKDGPSFAASQPPDFEMLEGRYRLLRARLDRAIQQRVQALR